MKRGSLYAFFILAAVLSAYYVSGVNVNGCGDLSEENAVYKISRTILHSGSKNCIKITAENVTLDCQNNSILTSSNAEVAGIYSEFPKTKIRDCIVNGFRGYGIYIKNSDNSIISGSSVEKNKIGIYSEGNNTKIAYNSINFNEKGTIIRGKNNLMSNNHFCYNTLEDINCTCAQTFENNHCDSGSVCGESCFPCTHKDYELYECKELNQSNSGYLLRTDLNISIPGTCFKITAENVTLDCGDHYINYDLDLVNKEDFLITSTSSRTIIKNCNFKGKLIDLRYTGNVINLSGDYSSAIGNSFNAVKTAFYSDYCYECNISGNEFRNIDGNSIEIINSELSFIENNEIVASLNAIKISEGKNTRIKNNYLEGSKNNSIIIKNNYANIENNHIINTGNKGITIVSSEGSYLLNNKIENSETGLSLIKSNELLIKNNTVYSANFGIYVEGSENLKILENKVGDSSLGFKQDSGGLLIIENNIFCGNNIDVSCSSNNNFIDNQCNSYTVCGGKCKTCGVNKLSLWIKIRNFFMNLF